MRYKLAKFFHSLSLRIPQAYAVRSGLRVFAYTRQQNSLFWSTFTSSEYLSLMPAIIKSDIRPKIFIDCGAATGYVSLLITHLIKSGLLEWKLDKVICIEPSSFNIGVLRLNMFNNKITSEVIEGVVGKREGDINFFESKNNPWSASVTQRFHSGKPGIRSYYNLDAVLDQKDVFLKIDVEGSEFDFMNAYQKKLANVNGIIIEWHHEMGNVRDAEGILLSNGFTKVKTSLNKDKREVSLYLRNPN